MITLSRAALEKTAERAADAVLLCGRLDLLEPLAMLIEALDAMDADPDLEDGHDAEGSMLSDPSQWKLTFGRLSQAEIAVGRLPPDVRGYAPLFHR